MGNKMPIDWVLLMESRWKFYFNPKNIITTSSSFFFGCMNREKHKIGG